MTKTDKLKMKNLTMGCWWPNRYYPKSKRGRPKAGKNVLKDQKNYILQPTEQVEQIEQVEEKRVRGKSKGRANTLKISPVFSSVYIPYEKSKEDKTGKVIKYQGVWLIDIFTNGVLTLKGFDASIVKLVDAVGFIDSEIARL